MMGSISRKAQYKDVYRRTIEILQRAQIWKANCCLKVHNAAHKVCITNSVIYEECFHLPLII